MSRPVPALPSPGLLAEGNREVGSCLSAISALQYWLRMRQKRSSTRQQCTPNQIALQEPRAAWMKPEVKIRCNITPISYPCSSSALESRTSTWSGQSSVPQPGPHPAHR
ncbi:uncharacterized protein LOC107054405 isoform X3 [Gallus gallus]|uniref:uncharacterized protein LOC107054405 isoform X3 n=1 Tax=Gallus gallus TaxID=9031 RepID=UPI001F01C1F1|nr:uncharacterized protein LOC107054405 isoform X3 [Gallus gallus]